MNDQLRPPGYYWVRYDDKWIIAEYGKFTKEVAFTRQPGWWGWNIIGTDRFCTDSSFSDISEKTIKP